MQPLDLSRIPEVDVWFDSPAIVDPLHAGTLHRDQTRTGQTISFEYTSRWLGLPPSAIFAFDEQLPLFQGRHIATADAADVPPALEDCSPDRWGRLLMDRRETMLATAQSRRPKSLRPWDYLLGVNDQSRMGALRFIDPASARYLDDSEPSPCAALIGTATSASTMHQPRPCSMRPMAATGVTSTLP